MDKIELDKIKKEANQDGFSEGVRTALEWAIEQLESKIDNSQIENQVILIHSELCKDFKNLLNKL